MPPNSETSSLEAHNGSANSLQQNHAGSPSQRSAARVSYSARQTRYSGGISNHPQYSITRRPGQDSHTISNGYQREEGYASAYSSSYTYSNGDRCTWTSTSNTRAISEQQEELPGGAHTYREHGHYYLLGTSLFQEQPNYDAVLEIDPTTDEQAATEAGPSSNRTNSSKTPESVASGAYPQHGPDVSHMPTTRWFCAYSTDERMRMGFPRWETEHARPDYEHRHHDAQHATAVIDLL